MNAHPTTHEGAQARLFKNDPLVPALKAIGRDNIAIRGGTSFAGRTFVHDTPAPSPTGVLTPGADYIVVMKEGSAEIALAAAIPVGDDVLGGFHYAPGGNADGIPGGDAIPAINPCSIWDVNFRPSCSDPRGMALVQTPERRFWCDIYLTGANHSFDGTSKFGVAIADGEKGTFDYETARSAVAAHGKGLLSVEEFFAAAYGVTERTAAKHDPKKTGLDAARTSRFGLMQATGNLWVWGHDGHPDIPRASILGGSWISGVGAGSRCALVDLWTGRSVGDLGARGRSDHLQLD